MKKQPIYLIILCLALIAVLMPWYIYKIFDGSIFFAIIGEVLFLMSLEVCFRKVYAYRNGAHYIISPKIPFKKVYVEPHPYLTFVYKKHVVSQKPVPANYALNKDKGYMYGQYKLNNFRRVNGCEGGRDIAIPKPDDLIRVSCLGDSTTANYLVYNGKSYSYPSALEKKLLTLIPQRKIEVNNFGSGLYTSAEILIDFLINSFDTEPDIVVFCNAHTDLEVLLTPGFCSDYSHARRNLGEAYQVYRFTSKIPYIPIPSALYDYLYTKVVKAKNIRATLLSLISKGKPDFNLDYQGFNTYKRNIEHIVNICLNNGIHIILSTYCFYLYDKAKQDPVSLKRLEGVAKANDVLKEIAEEYGLSLVDNYNLIPKDEKYFVDFIHFSPEGMEMMAQNVSVPIVEYLKRKIA